jgi:thymidylate synthase (FAD)
MKIIAPYHEILACPEGDAILRSMELVGRTCYKSEAGICNGSAAVFVRNLIARHHDSVLEHISISARFVCDRGVTHELVRHRMASFSQESTRYANYSQERFGREITVVRPAFWSGQSREYAEWLGAMQRAEESYMRLMDLGARPEHARSVLPNSLKSEIVMTCNLREWRHVLNLRCSREAHPQIRELLLPFLAELHERVPIVFDDLFEKHRSSA